MKPGAGRPGRGGIALLGGLAVLSLLLCSCTTAKVAGGSSGVPPSSFADHTGITSTSIDVGTVATLNDGLFKGAVVGMEAYAAYLNSTGGIDGRRLVVNSYNDSFSGAGNLQATREAAARNFALVGGFSLQDTFGASFLAQNPGIPDVAVTINATTARLPNLFTPQPVTGGWITGPLLYLKNKFPGDVGAVGTIVPDLPGTVAGWEAEKNAMDRVGMKVVYDPTVGISQTDFTSNVIAMRNAGVKLVVIDHLTTNYTSAVLRDLQQQDYHPIVMVGPASYGNQLAARAGGPSAVNGVLFDTDTSLYLGADASQLPAVALFDTWVQKTAPGFQPDQFTLFGWLSAELFAEAMRNAGADPSRGALLRALARISSFDGGHIIPATDPVAKQMGTCYLIGQIADGTFQRLDDPPVSSATHGYRCDGMYVPLPR